MYIPRHSTWFCRFLLSNLHTRVTPRGRPLALFSWVYHFTRKPTLGRNHILTGIPRCLRLYVQAERPFLGWMNADLLATMKKAASFVSNDFALFRIDAAVATLVVVSTDGIESRFLQG